MPNLVLPVLQGSHCRLDPLSTRHSTGMFDLWRAPEVCEHSGPSVDAHGDPIDLPAASRAQSDRLLHYWLERARSGTGCRWAVMPPTGSTFLGAVGFNALAERAEYAYHLVPRYWGAGWATEASRLALAWVFATGVSSVEVFIPPENTRSVRLAQRLGFEPSGPPRDGATRYVLHRRAA